MPPQIDSSGHFELPPNGEIILRQMFPTHQRIVIKRDFTSLGYSGSWVYEVSLIKNEGMPNQSDLPVVVKIAAVSLIEKEVQAYQECIKDKWLHVAAWRGEPVFHGELGGLAYTLVGGGIFPIQSLREYCLDAEMSDIDHVLQRLFEVMKAKILLPAIPRREYRLRQSYDAVLPVNLLIEHLALSASENPILITPDDLPRESLSIGTCVQLKGFIVTKVDLPDQSMTLNLPADSQNAYRVRLNYKPEAFTHDLSDFQIGHRLPPMTGKVIENRSDCFHEKLQALSKALGAKFDPTCEQLTLADDTHLPNPLHAIPSILESTRDLKFNHIHGDLNLENVLVDSKGRDFRLIDFAEARYEHVLHDFLRLETEVITKLLPTALADAKLPAEAVVPFYQQLHCATFLQAGGSPAHQALEKPFAILSAIRHAARDGFYDPNDGWSEYYECLTLYLVGVLRFQNLDQISMSKEAAFWGAATVQQLLTNPPTCPNPRSTGRIMGYVSTIVQLVGVVGVVAAVVWIIFVLIGPAETDPTEPLAVLTQVDPKVEVRRMRTDDYQLGKFSLPLYYDEVVVAYENAEAQFMCSNGLLFNVPSQNNVTVKCEDTADPRLIARLNSQIASQIVPTQTLSLEEDWSPTRTDQAQPPLLLSPRNTMITDTRPTFHWQEVEGASGYQIALDFPNDGDWQAESSQSSLPYPADKPPLPAGSTIFVKLTTYENPNLVDETFLDVMDEASLAELAAAESQIRQLAVNNAAKSYFLAQLYRQREMYGAAITQLEQIAATEDAISADLWQQLGDLYLEIDLHAEAETNYQSALTIAQADGDPKAEANAYVGLALTANESTKAAEHLEQAEALYRQIGLDTRADQVAKLRAELVPSE